MTAPHSTGASPAGHGGMPAPRAPASPPSAPPALPGTTTAGIPAGRTARMAVRVAGTRPVTAAASMRTRRGPPRMAAGTQAEAMVGTEAADTAVAEAMVVAATAAEVTAEATASTKTAAGSALGFHDDPWANRPSLRKTDHDPVRDSPAGNPPRNGARVSRNPGLHR